jgi:hypothetical protein
MKIKFRSLFTALALGTLLSAGAYAQEAESAESSSSGGTGMELKFGLEVGGTWSSFARNMNSFTDKQAGYTIGAFAKTQLMGPLGVSVGLLYSQQGAANIDPYFTNLPALVNNGGIYTRDVDIKTHKVALPILINITPNDMPGAGDVKPVAYAGVEVDYLVAANQKSYKELGAGNQALVLGNSAPVSYTSSMNTFDYGAVIGAGITFEGEDRGYGIDVKYKMGINNVNNALSYFISNYFNQNSLSVSLKVGL